jgi:hypothetical protein
VAMTPLGALIEECQARFLDHHGVELTYGDISRRGGRVIGRTRVQQLAKDPLKAMPSPETLRALALGLGVTEALVVERALASTGYGDYGLAARRGRPEPDLDAPGPEAGA